MPLLDVFWTMLMIFFWILWFVLLLRVYGDVFSRNDIGGWAKAGWVLFTLFLPFLGAFVYLSRRAGGWPSGPPPNSSGSAPRATPTSARWQLDAQAEQRGKARDLLESGAITHPEYERMVPSVNR